MKFKLVLLVALLTINSPTLFAGELEEQEVFLPTSSSFFETEPGVSLVGINNDRLVIKAGSNNHFSNPNKVYVYSPEGKLIHTLEPSQAIGWQLYPGVNGQFVSEYGNEIAIWNTEQGSSPVMTFNIDSPVGYYYYMGSDVAMNPDGRTVAFTGRGLLRNTTMKFSTSDGTTVKKSNIGGQAISQDGNLVISVPAPWAGSYVGAYRPFTTGKTVVNQFAVPEAPMIEAFCSPDATKFVYSQEVGSDMLREEVWDTQTGEKLGTIPLGSYWQDNFERKFSQDGKFLAIVTNQKLKVYDTKAYQPVREFALEDNLSTNDMWFTSDNKQLFLLSNTTSGKPEKVTPKTKSKHVRNLLRFNDKPEVKKIIATLDLVQEKTSEPTTSKVRGRIDVFDIDLDS